MKLVNDNNKASPSITRMPLAQRDEAILATVHEGARGRGTAATHRRALREKARYLTDVEHFKRLCLADLKAAFHADPDTRSRSHRQRRRAWLALFRYFAEQRGIT